jgi:hypothetical protein
LKLLKDLGYALRQLRKNPGFALTAVLSLAFGIAATTSVFSVIYGLVMHPYPYRTADRMIDILIEDKAGNHDRVLLTGSQFEQLRHAKQSRAASHGRVGICR